MFRAGADFTKSSYFSRGMSIYFRFTKMRRQSMTDTKTGAAESTAGQTKYYVVKLKHQGNDLKIPIRHPDTFVDDVWNIIRQCKTEKTQPVADKLVALVNDSKFLIEIAPGMKDNYYDYLFRQEGWLSTENLTPMRDGKLDNLNAVMDLHAHGKLNAAFDPVRWAGNEAEALQVFRTIDRVLPGGWLDETRNYHLPRLEVAAGLEPSSIAGRIAAEQLSPGRIER